MRICRRYSTSCFIRSIVGLISFPHSGHYVADVYDQASGDWVHCDDDKISKRTIIDVR